MSDESREEQVHALAAQLQEVQGYLLQVQQQSEEVEQGLKALELFSQGMSDQRVRIPVISGVYVDGCLDNTDQVLVDVGAGVIVKKSFALAQEYLKNKYGELSQVQEHLLGQFNSLYEEFVRLQKHE